MAITIKQNVTIINYELRRGDTFDPSLTYNDSTETPIDLTGYTAKLDIKDAIDGNIITQLTDVSGITLGGPVADNVKILILPAVTELYTVASMVYDLELTDTLGVIKTLTEGKITLKLDVSL